jgi:FMN phosphatase YigB (HAD superfamily)
MRTREKRPIKACAFDLGNTLINDTQLAGEATHDMSEWLLNKSFIQSRKAFRATLENINHGTRQPFISHTYGELEFFEKTFGELAVNAISAEAALNKYREILMQKIHPDKDIVDTFRLIKQKNIRIALLSNESVARVDAYLDKTNLKPFFDTIIVSEGIGIEKPDLRFFQEALNRFIYFVLVTGYMTKDWVWEKGNPHTPDYIMEKITPKNMAAFLSSIALDR